MINFPTIGNRINLPHDKRPLSERCLGVREFERVERIDVGDSILCTNGVLWVTQTGDPEDYLLRKGQKFVAGRRGLVLIQTFDGSACRYYVDNQANQ